MRLSVVTISLAGVASVSARNCVELQVPVHVEATNINYQTLRVNSNIDAVEWTLDLEYEARCRLLHYRILTKG